MITERMQQLAGVQINEGYDYWGFDKAGVSNVEDFTSLLKKWGFSSKPELSYPPVTKKEVTIVNGNREQKEVFLLGFHWHNKMGDIFFSAYDPVTGKHFKSGTDEKGSMYYVGIEGPNAKAIASDLKKKKSFYYSDESKGEREFI